jgi:hypothetical protein
LFRRLQVNAPALKVVNDILQILHASGKKAADTAATLLPEVLCIA